KERLEAGGIAVDTAEFDMEPSTTQLVEGKQARQMLRLMEAFEDHDDVQNVWANFDVGDEDLDDV
ncbi:MAG TPA: YebC/PmpR family DNA-binding transcriptional regulator, partial [Candidatus Sulfomarinibacteraceae bacterium]|nr:YebC/PmpR family DNA-binding transcriptional regulator [Candidatus Sulfomarinibacteraceae bacterium]